MTKIDLQKLSSPEYRDIKKQLDRIEAMVRFQLQSTPVAMPLTGRDDDDRRRLS